MSRWHTDDAAQLEGRLLPAYERELAYAKAKGDRERVDAITAEINALKAHLGHPVETAIRKPAEKRGRSSKA